MAAKKLFLAYSNRDEGFARQLRAHLKAKGLVVDEPSTDVSSGEAWAEAIRQHIEGADAILAVIPENGRGTANNVFFEMGAARALNKPILAVIPNGGSSEAPRELPSSLKGMFVLDAEDKSVESVVNTLASTLLAA
jgi:hypothetical protein